jgi:hypothetical protein
MQILGPFPNEIIHNHTRMFLIILVLTVFSDWCILPALNVSLLKSDFNRSTIRALIMTRRFIVMR